MAKQGNESAIHFGERCQDLRSLLIAKVNVTEESRTIRAEKTHMYGRLAVKTFMKGLREPLSLIVRCRNPKTLEEAMNIIAEENNLNYQKKEIPQIPQKPNYPTSQPPIHRPPIHRPPMQMPSTSNFMRPSVPNTRPISPKPWQQPQYRPFIRPQIFNAPRPTQFPQGQPQIKPTPMDTLPAPTKRTLQPFVPYRPPPYNFQRTSIQQSRQHTSPQELHYQEDYPYESQDQFNEYYDESYQWPNYEEQYETFEENVTQEEYEEPSTSENIEASENQDFHITGPDKTKS